MSTDPPQTSRFVGALALTALMGCGSGDPPYVAGELRVVEAEQVGILPRSDWIEGRDGGSSGLAFGQSIWVYGDTVLTREDEAGVTWHTNSYDVRDPSDWMHGFTTRTDSVGAPLLLMPLTEEEQEYNRLHGPEDCAEPPCGASWALWPSGPIYDPERDRAWFLYGLYNDEQPSGIGIASWDGLDEPVVRHRVDGSWLLFPKPQPEWANAPVIFEGYLYAFGCVLDFVAHKCMLGRAPAETPDDPAAWRFYDGGAWSADMDDAKVLFEAAPIMHVSYVRSLERWLLVYSPPFDNEARARIAERLEGPWSRAFVLFDAPGEAPYDVVHHPELEEEGGAVQYISYSRPLDDGSWFGSEHVLWRVTLALEP